MVASQLSGGEPAITGSLIEIGALRALGLATSGEDAAAVDALAAALTLACPQGYVRVFADEGPPMAALLAELIAAQRSGGAVAEIPLGWLARLQRALSRGPCGRCRARDMPTGFRPGGTSSAYNRSLCRSAPVLSSYSGTRLLVWLV